MYEVKEGAKHINDLKVRTYLRETPALAVEAGTTGYCGGGRDAGGRTYLRITPIHADFYARVTEVDGMELAVCGDEELDALIKTLEFALKVLRDAIWEEVE